MTSSRSENRDADVRDKLRGLRRRPPRRNDEASAVRSGVRARWRTRLFPRDRHDSPNGRKDDHYAIDSVIDIRWSQMNLALKSTLTVIWRWLLAPRQGAGEEEPGTLADGGHAGGRDRPNVASSCGDQTPSRAVMPNVKNLIGAQGTLREAFVSYPWCPSGRLPAGVPPHRCLRKQSQMAATRGA